VDTLKGGRIANRKELRFSADGGVGRAAFAFDRRRIAVLLVIGDKRGMTESRFYKALVATAAARWKTRGG
jgi:hypothetical protein